MTAGQTAPRRGNWRPRLVVLDLDGTTVAINQLTPSSRVSAAIRATILAGVPVTVATGRPVWATLPTVESLKLAPCLTSDGARGTGGARGVRGAGRAGIGPSVMSELSGKPASVTEPQALSVVCSNGSIVYDAARRRAVHRFTVDPGPAIRAMAKARPEAGFAVEHGLVGYRYTRQFVRDFPSTFLDEVEINELVAAPTTRASGRVPGVPVPRSHTRCEVAAAWIGDAGLSDSDYSYEIGYSGWVDVSAPGVSKGNGVALLARDLEVEASDVLVIGDGGNDLSMFAWAGRSVAMGQAPPEVQAAADEVTASVEEDGVALVLEQWLN
ncbi:MAG: HAD family hydrolase [Micromonosporaceae bacterium]